MRDAPKTPVGPGEEDLVGYPVRDSSMSPAFKKGDIAVVNPNLPGRPGDYVVATVGETTVLRKLSASGKRLSAVAEGFPPLSALSAEIVGRVVEKKRIYK